MRSVSVCEAASASANAAGNDRSAADSAERSSVQPTLLVIRRWTNGLGISLEEVIRRASEDS